MKELEKGFYQLVEGSDIGRALTDYLRMRGMLPPVVEKYLGDSVNAAFTLPNDKHPKGQIAVNWGFEPNAGWRGTAAHELTHAAESAMQSQYDQMIRRSGRNMLTNRFQGSPFETAYEKLKVFVDPAGRDSHERVSLLTGDPAWVKQERGYRVSPEEITAFGVGNMARGVPSSRSAPGHLDSTKATELAILLELARRQAQKP